ncbi:dehydrogenase/reductase SDR family member 12 isoform X11 [Sorex araneus]|uniref:dehydrogenase/reductase SDR family member 12 isoform X11 n=1 Tax=Sorex araneus TaxID=42254 RepID=UPI002433E72E|nr:dehydrogenase/reductase SDR family member 12 isoform X11 [Sorex araneus]
MVPCIPLGVIPEHRAMSEPRAQPGVAPKQNTSATKHALRIAFIQHGAFGQVEKNTFSKHPLPPVRSGYEAAAQHFSPEDLDVQVSGRAFLVTGANSGLGKATALEIAKRGGTVHLVCRDAARSEAAQTEILRESGNQNIFLHIVDLSDPKEIWKFVENFKQEHTLNVLVTVSSGGMLVQKLSTLDLQWERAAFDGTMVYAQNKRQQVVMTEQWARVHPTIHFSAMHPGWADTPVPSSPCPILPVSHLPHWCPVFICPRPSPCPRLPPCRREAGHAGVPRQVQGQAAHGGAGGGHCAVAGAGCRRLQAAQRPLLPRSETSSQTLAACKNLLLAGGRGETHGNPGRDGSEV